MAFKQLILLFTLSTFIACNSTSNNAEIEALRQQNEQLKIQNEQIQANNEQIKASNEQINKQVENLQKEQKNLTAELEQQFQKNKTEIERLEKKVREQRYTATTNSNYHASRSQNNKMDLIQKPNNSETPEESLEVKNIKAFLALSPEERSQSFKEARELEEYEESLKEESEGNPFSGISTGGTTFDLDPERYKRLGALTLGQDKEFYESQLKYDKK